MTTDSNADANTRVFLRFQRFLRLLVAVADRRPRKPRRRARTCRRSRPTGSKDASPARTASASRATTSSPSCRRSARSRCRGSAIFRLPFEFTAGTKDGGSTRHQRHERGRRASRRRRSRQRARSRSPTTATSTAPVVFAGYGIVVPESQDFGYDSYATLDVKDKIVLVLRYFPEDAEQKTRQHPRALRGPALQGDGGAAARREGDARRHRSAIAERRRTGADDVRHGARRLGHRRGQHQRRPAQRDLRAARSKTLEEAQKALDSGNPHVAGFALPGVDASRCTRRSCARSRPATTSSPTCRRPRRSATLAKPWVALGAHYDHLGHGEAGNSLGGQGRGGEGPHRRRRQRVGLGRRARRRRQACRSSRAAATSWSASGRAKSSG